MLEFDAPNPEHTGTSQLDPRSALLAAIRAIRLGMSDADAQARFGVYAAQHGRTLWQGMHLKQWELRADALAVLSHEMRDPMSKPCDRINAAARCLEAIDRHQDRQEKADHSLLTDTQLRDKALDEMRRPSQVVADIIVEAWSDTGQAMVKDIMTRLAPKWWEETNTESK